MSIPTGNHQRTPRQISRGPPPSAPPTTPSWTKSKRIIWTGAFAAVTIVCSIYGAGLKMQQEYHAEKKKVLEAPVEDRIRDLNGRRAALVAAKRPLEEKLEELRQRVRKEEEQEEESASKTTKGRS